MSVLTVFENDRVSVGPGASQLTAADRDALLALSERCDGFCTAEEGGVRLEGHCGLVALPSGRLLEVLPKVLDRRGRGVGRGFAEDFLGHTEQAIGEQAVGQLDSTSPASEFVGMLVRMLGLAGDDFAMYRMDSSVGHVSTPLTGGLLEVFVSAFLSHVHILALGGLHQDYRTVEGDLGAVRGRIQLQRQATTLWNRKDAVACSYDERSTDHALNRVVKAALVVVSRFGLPPDQANRCRQLLLLFRDVDLAGFDPLRTLRTPRFDRQSARYRPAVEWAARILRFESPAALAGHLPAPEILFDMPLLFESAVGGILSRRATERGLHADLQRAGFLVTLLGDENTGMVRMRPDYILRDREGKVLAVGDAKWKPLDLLQGNLLPRNKDVYQLSAYAYGFDADAAIIYPWFADYDRRRMRETTLVLPATVPGRPPRKITIILLDVRRDDLGVVMHDPRAASLFVDLLLGPQESV
ncbi:McrBC 5-methylcytosine restriction system component-domain-containing protein [Hyaloraphidium curvatum]|nr:McrBC 5-methylcytosine restriction system component-domain-containing protein [Hyaloraphidium curvatum]